MSPISCKSLRSSTPSDDTFMLIAPFPASSFEGLKS